MNFVFWNIKGKTDLHDTVIELVKHYEVDILILAEAPLGIYTDLIKHPRFKQFIQVSDGNDKVEVFSRIKKESFNKVLENKRWTGYQIKIPDKLNLNLVAVHLPSKVNWSNESLSLECVNLANQINEMERKSGNKNTILIGDFNMNPFEPGIISANGLNAIQDLNYVKDTKSRVVNGIPYEFFYNPMWNYFGDNDPPFGTHYNRRSENVSYEWNIFDQVLIRPQLLELMDKNCLEVIKRINNTDLFSAYYRPNKNEYSDHYPIALELKF